MISSSLLLSVDSLIVALGLSAVMARRHTLPFAMLVGTCDTAASMAGLRLGLAFPPAQDATGLCLILWGVLILVLRWGGDEHGSRRVASAPAWALLALLSADNVALPAPDPIIAGVCSAAMCGVGFFIGTAVMRASRLDRGSRWAAVPQIAAGAGLFAL
jgi:hypothetical protein